VAAFAAPHIECQGCRRTPFRPGLARVALFRRRIGSPDIPLPMGYVRAKGAIFIGCNAIFDALFFIALKRTQRDQRPPDS
jgi:hypothetical protein